MGKQILKVKAEENYSEEALQNISLRGNNPFLFFNRNNYFTWSDYADEVQ